MLRLVKDFRLPPTEVYPGVERDLDEGGTFRWGASREWLEELRHAWLYDFDWRKVEAQLNAFPQFTAQIEQVNVHFIHQTSSRKDAIPIVLTHGWPGSVYEFVCCVNSV